jgi:hypothetical protein
VLRGGTPPLVPMWPGVRIAERNPYPFFPFNPRWRERFAPAEFECFCALLKLAWISPRPCFLPPDSEDLRKLLQPYARRGCAALSERVLGEFNAHSTTGLLYFPPQLRALQRLVEGEDLYALLWEE